jgi:hypothetical protein
MVIINTDINEPGGSLNALRVSESLCQPTEPLPLYPSKIVIL